MLQNYPQVLAESNDALFEVLARIVQIREDDIQSLNEVIRLNSYESGFKRVTISVTSDRLIGENDLYIDVDATSGASTATLTASPVDGQTHYIAKSDASGNAVTIDGNGKTINGAATIALAAQYNKTMLVFMGGSGEWREFI